MDLPVCLSHNFVNKQNIRSFGNILELKYLKRRDNAKFLNHIFEEKELVSELATDFHNALSSLKNNLIVKSKTDFKNYFSTISKDENCLCIVNKEKVFECCWIALNEIIPKNMFGGNHNLKMFRKLIRATVFSIKKQHTTLIPILEHWDFSTTLWKTLKTNEKLVLHKILSWLIKHVLSPIIGLNFYVTSCKLDADEYKLYYFWKNQWQRFYDKKISNLIFCKMLKRHEPYFVSKRMKTTFNISQKSKLKLLKKEIPKLYLILKPNINCRPIVRYKSEQSLSQKYVVKERLNFLKKLSGKPNKRIETEFNTIHKSWTLINKPKLYFIKTDLSNAFGLINKEKLMKILCEKHLNLQKTEKNLYMKKKFAQQYKEIIAELRKPLLVRAGNTVYEWTEGLVQGYRYSPALSELYYGYLDDVYFSEHFDSYASQVKLFIRVVDDYLYITDSLDDAHSFLDALSSYRNVNYDKTIVNFPHDKIKTSEEITFLGYSYNTNTLEVSRASNVYSGQMCYKIAFTSSLNNLNKFFENRIGQSGIQINGHIFNLHHNPEELIWRHIFTTFCLSANKFCTILSVCVLSQSSDTEMCKYLSLYKKRVCVKLGNSIIETLIRNKPEDYLFMYCINHFRYLAFQALYLCAKHTSKCSVLIPWIKDQLAKCNCLNGKWREHACRIETSGEMRRQAIREICTRTDLRKIVKGFDKLPEGFQCYNQRKIELSVNK